MQRVSLALIATISIAVGLRCFGREANKQPPLRPRLAECTLSVGDKTLKPVRVLQSWQYQYPAGARSVSINGKTVTAYDGKTGKTAWSVDSADGWSLDWLAADEKTAYFRAMKEEKEDEPQPERPARIRRLQLDNHQWLTPLEIKGEKAKETQNRKDKKEPKELAVSVLPQKQGTTVLTVTVTASFPEGEVAQSYRVSGFRPGRDKPAWSRSYPSAGNRSAPGAFLLSAPHRPDYAVESIKSLVAVGPNVLVCAGSLEDLICLDPESGKEVWRAPRVWEFRRGFIGPSVWNHYIGRYGMQDCDVKVATEGPGKGDKIDPEYLKELKEEVKTAKARIEAEENAIVAGPMIVPTDDHPDEPGFSIFVAVARSGKSPFAGYLSDCVIYELSQSGEPIGIATLPRMVNGWQSYADNRGVLWACQNNAFVKLAPGAGRKSMGMMLGGTDMLCRVAWYCQPEPPPTPEAWLTADPAGDPVAFSSTYAFRPAGDGYILKADDQVYHFPIRRLNLQTTGSEQLLLHVPFEGKVILPTTNYSQGEGTTHAMGPYLLGVTWLEVNGNVLRIVLSWGDAGASAVEFDLADLGAAKSK